LTNEIVVCAENASALALI